MSGVVCIIVFIVSIGLTSLCFVDDLCQILGMFSLNSITGNKVRSCWYLGGKYNRQMYGASTCSNLERFEVIF